MTLWSQRIAVVQFPGFADFGTVSLPFAVSCRVPSVAGILSSPPASFVQRAAVSGWRHGVFSVSAAGREFKSCATCSGGWPWNRHFVGGRFSKGAPALLQHHRTARYHFATCAAVCSRGHQGAVHMAHLIQSTELQQLNFEL